MDTPGHGKAVGADLNTLQTAKEGFEEQLYIIQVFSSGLAMR